MMRDKMRTKNSVMFFQLFKLIFLSGFFFLQSQELRLEAKIIFVRNVMSIIFL